MHELDEVVCNQKSNLGCEEKASKSQHYKSDFLLIDPVTKIMRIGIGAKCTKMLMESLDTVISLAYT
jgi:hypothetical protein